MSPPVQQLALGHVTVGGRTATCYVALVADTAVLGLAVADDTGARRYLPLYASTYRGLPCGTVTVLASADDEVVWITSSWPGYEVLGHCRLDRASCVTRYGLIHAGDVPLPDVLGGELATMPALDARTTRTVATFTVPELPAEQ